MRERRESENRMKKAVEESIPISLSLQTKGHS